MNLNEKVIFEIANSELRSKAIDLIKENVEHSYKTASDESRNEILFDSLLDLIQFTLKKGFSLNECVTCCSIFHMLIKKMNGRASDSITLPKGLDIFSSKLISLTNCMSKTKIRQYIDYMNLTFFTHFNLFKYVFTNDRENHVYTERRFVNCPVPEEDIEDKSQISLSGAKTFQLYEYEKEFQKLEDRGNLIRNSYEKERGEIINSQKTIEKHYEHDGDLNEKIIEEMIKDISFPKVDLACQLTKKDISEFYELQGIKEQQNELVKPDPITFAKKNPKNKAKK